MSRSKVLAFGFAVCVSVGTGLAAQTAETAFGTWQHPENGSHIELYACGNDLCAKITKVTDGQKFDDKNPEAEMRKRPIVGLVIMQGAKRAGPAQWAGSLYNRIDGGIYEGTIKVKSKDQIDLSGCTAVVICRTVTWSRVK